MTSTSNNPEQETKLVALQPRTSDAMRLFIEKAHKLASSRFIQYIKSNAKGIHVSYRVGGEFNIDWDAPDSEVVEAFVLTLRFFLQDKDKISFRAMQKIMSSDPGISQYCRQQYEMARNALNAFLDEPPRQLQVSWERRSLTRREIVDVFVYGGLAHADEDKRRIFEGLKADPFFFPMFEFNFITTLNEIVQAVGYVARLCDRELKGQNDAV